MKIWVLILLCQCAQPKHALFATYDACERQGKRELYEISTSVYAIPKFRCKDIPQ